MNRTSGRPGVRLMQLHGARPTAHGGAGARCSDPGTAPQGSDRAPACQAIVTGLSTPELNVAFEKLEWFWGELGSFDRP